jgi:hypothetical protein
MKRAEAAVCAHVLEHPGAVRVAAGEDRGPRRAAQRVRDHVAAEGRPLLLQGQDLRHVWDEVRRQVVRQHEDDVRALGRSGLRRAEQRDERQDQPDQRKTSAHVTIKHDAW